MKLLYPGKKCTQTIGKETIDKLKNLEMLSPDTPKHLIYKYNLI